MERRSFLALFGLAPVAAVAGVRAPVASFQVCRATTSLLVTQDAIAQEVRPRETAEDCAVRLATRWTQRWGGVVVGAREDVMHLSWRVFLRHPERSHAEGTWIEVAALLYARDLLAEPSWIASACQAAERAAWLRADNSGIPVRFSASQAEWRRA